jgi:hypothetical protein
MPKISIDTGETVRYTPLILTKGWYETVVQLNQEMADSIGTKIVRELIDKRIVRSKYHLMRLMNVSSEDVVTAWYDGRYFNEARHLKRLLEVRDEWMRMKQIGIYGA